MLPSYPDLIRKIYKLITKFPEPYFLMQIFKFIECSFARYIVIQEYLQVTCIWHGSFVYLLLENA